MEHLATLQCIMEMTNVTIRITTTGIVIEMEGYECKTGRGPIMIEMDPESEAHPTVYVWADKSKEEPTHKISLQGAMFPPCKMITIPISLDDPEANDV